MLASPTELLHEWHDFFLLVGTASATLVGLVFVAASIGSSIFSEEHRAPLRTFISPTVAHFTAALVTCLLAVMPIQDWRILGGLLGAEGLAGLIYCGEILVQLVLKRQYRVDLIDRLFYALVPILAYLLLAISAVLLLMQAPASVDVIAAGLLTLLLAGIRNAWDMTLWIAIRTPSSRGPSP
jgi:uncharacterized protein (TIGR04206 family)